MEIEPSLDQLVSALAPHLPRHADDLLDLRTMSKSPQLAGSCVRIYFELLEAAPDKPGVATHLAGLRKWLETRMDILVFDQSHSTCIRTIPFSLNGQKSLGDFCESAMHHVRKNIRNPSPCIRLEFSFSRATSPAA
ncbi:MAG: hypothetical protein ACSHX7_04585 [Luteolibacter sp.]